MLHSIHTLDGRRTRGCPRHRSVHLHAKHSGAKDEVGQTRRKEGDSVRETRIERMRLHRHRKLYEFVHPVRIHAPNRTLPARSSGNIFPGTQHYIVPALLLFMTTSFR